jgi:hypothetical protein
MFSVTKNFRSITYLDHKKNSISIKKYDNKDPDITTFHGIFAIFWPYFVASDRTSIGIFFLILTKITNSVYNFRDVGFFHD